MRRKSCEKLGSWAKGFVIEKVAGRKFSVSLAIEALVLVVSHPRSTRRERGAGFVILIVVIIEAAWGKSRAGFCVFIVRAKGSTRAMRAGFAIIPITTEGSARAKMGVGFVIVILVVAKGATRAKMGASLAIVIFVHTEGSTVRGKTRAGFVALSRGSARTPRLMIAVVVTVGASSTTAFIAIISARFAITVTTRFAATRFAIARLAIARFVTTFEVIGLLALVVAAVVVVIVIVVVSLIVLATGTPFVDATFKAKFQGPRAARGPTASLVAKARGIWGDVKFLVSALRGLEIESERIKTRSRRD